VLKQLEENPACAYNHLAFLKKLHNPLTNEVTLGKVIQLGSIVDQYVKAVQRRIDNGTRLSTQQQTHTMFYEKAQKAQAEADKLATQVVEGNPRLENCDKNIAFYKQQIGFLEAQIEGYKRKFSEEEALKVQIEEEMKASTQEMIDAKGR
jgi:chromosome segregation ATPase